MNVFLQKAAAVLNGFSLINALDILLISALLYITFKFLVKYNSAALIKIFLLILAAALLSSVAGLIISGELAKYFFATCYLAVVVIYSSEIKRGIWALAKRPSFDKHPETKCTEEELRNSTDEIVRAVQNMAKKDIGALIVFLQGEPPPGIMESGIALNGLVSSQLVESIFIPKSPLHDGAVLIRENKILAAGCFLPLSLEVNLPKEFGTRHRAAIGITEQYNVMAVVVSEETGIISIASNGELKRYIDGEMLKSAIEKVYGLNYGKTEIKWYRKDKKGDESQIEN
jgi:diadenylate cyclase